MISHAYRTGLDELVNTLSKKFELMVLSGDNDGELNSLKAIFPEGTRFVFNQKPEAKLP